GYFNLATDYFENFNRTNALSPEMILAIPYDEIKAQGFNIHMMTLHYASQATYNLQAQPWNGFCSLQEFYESFDSADARKNSFIVGPQYAKDGTRLEDPGADNQDPDGPPITFTPEINSIGLNTYRQAGARIGKYEVYEGAGQDLDNDFPIFRYGEILLDKAEALWRLDPANSEALMLVNLFRKRANVPEFTQLNAENLLAERGRELAFETKRRTDLIRFGKYGDPWDFKDASDPCKTLFPIPQSQLEAGSNLKQNPCY
ncbi:MAG: RagB/SusD family nutrient uptake outer membrane protein, partial [Bacteroidetes bacterium]|nr:RagB/SusD family nutrient uptake outer membrane protein [Bacteroidota bacterium]